MGMEFDSKHEIGPSYRLAGVSPLPSDVGLSFFSGIQHSPVHSCSAASYNSGVLKGEDELMIQRYSYAIYLFFIKCFNFF